MFAGGVTYSEESHRATAAVDCGGGVDEAANVVLLRGSNNALFLSIQ